MCEYCDDDFSHDMEQPDNSDNTASINTWLKSFDVGLWNETEGGRRGLVQD